MPSGKYIRTDEVRANMSKAMMGNINGFGHHWKLSSETCANMSIAKIGNKYGWKGGRVESSRRHLMKRRGLGFNPLNSWFPGCEGHHLQNKTDVIYMPKILHRSIYHRQSDGRGMVEMDALAGAFLTEDWT